MSKLCRKGLIMIMIMILRHLNMHMLEICGKICRIYAPLISPNSPYFPAYFASNSSAYLKKIPRSSIKDKDIVY